MAKVRMWLPKNLTMKAPSTMLVGLVFLQQLKLIISAIF